ncbi:MAG: type II/IV secretion system ATPase subunit, partial [Halodesulfurarchaeum sp.]
MGTEESGEGEGTPDPEEGRSATLREDDHRDREGGVRPGTVDGVDGSTLRAALREGAVSAGRLDRAVTRARLRTAETGARNLDTALTNLMAGTVPVRKGHYTWLHLEWEYHRDEAGQRPVDADGEPRPFEPAAYLGFDPDDVESALSFGESRAEALQGLIEDRTVDVHPDLNEDAFFSTRSGATTVTNRYDLERAVPMTKKAHFVEEERYWVNKPYAFVVIFHSRKENEKKYYLVEPYRTPIESDLQEFLTEKLRTAIKYAEEGVTIGGSDEERRAVIERETDRLLTRYDLDGTAADRGLREAVADALDVEPGGILDRLSLQGSLDQLRDWLAPEREETDPESGSLAGIAARPEPALLAADDPTLNEYQVEKLRYYLTRDFTGYERIDGIKHDINVEDISCDGYESPVFVYHTDYEQLITNVTHGTEQLDDFVVKLAQRSGKGISKRQPQVDATLPDGSRAQLTLGTEVSDHGTNYTIRQFKDVPFTPVDLINWKTFSLEEMAFLWLCIENNKSLLFAGGTASGKTTSLNAVSLFVPSNAKIVSIEDTREVELPQRNW